MKSLAFLEHVDHNRKAAMHAAEHDGKVNDPTRERGGLWS